jgi:hypothetical protein
MALQSELRDTSTSHSSPSGSHIWNELNGLKILEQRQNIGVLYPQDNIRSTSDQWETRVQAAIQHRFR